ncbi:hypothetical protein ACROYT_G038815 [Oculina patagonica]
MTTIKVYGKIRSNSYSGNYTPCPSRTKQGTAVIETKLHSESVKDKIKIESPKCDYLCGELSHSGNEADTLQSCQK